MKPIDKLPATVYPELSAEDQALLALGQALRALDYQFTTITPESHARINARAQNAQARSLRDVFGWSRPFGPDVLDANLLSLLEQAGALVEEGGLSRSAVRFASLHGGLYVHSAYPTLDQDAVFFGPDTYRFANLLLQTFPAATSRAAALGRVVDVGCGSGAGGLLLASQTRELVLADINARALRYSAVNAALQGHRACQVVHSDVLDGVTGEIDVVVSNPPYIADKAARLYRDGGGPLGTALSVRIAEAALQRLRPGGRLVLYTGVPILAGQDPLWQALRPTLQRACSAVEYRELDPDVFGEELAGPAYAQAERIALVALIATRG